MDICGTGNGTVQAVLFGAGSNGPDLLIFEWLEEIPKQWKHFNEFGSVWSGSEWFVKVSN
jgi:hypothetical protein